MKRFATIIETVPTPCTVFGTVLLPFSLGHHVMFARHGLAFTDNPEADFTTDELLTGAFLCAHTYEENITGHIRMEFSAAHERWVKQVKRRKFDLKEAGEVFREHLREGYRIAPVWRHTCVKGVSMSAPWEMLLRVRLVHAGFTSKEVMNAYLPAAWYDYFAATEIEQLDKCEDASKWKKIFYTLQDALDDAAAEDMAGQIASQNAQACAPASRKHSGE